MTKKSKQFFMDFPEEYKNIRIDGTDGQVIAPVCIPFGDEFTGRRPVDGNPLVVEYVDIPELDKKEMVEIQKRFDFYKKNNVNVWYVLNCRELQFEEEICGGLQKIVCKDDPYHLLGFQGTESASLFLELNRDGKYPSHDEMSGNYMRVSSVYKECNRICIGSVYDSFVNNVFVWGNIKK